MFTNLLKIKFCSWLHILCVIILCFLTMKTWAQDRTVSGKVTSDESGNPGLPGVNVVVKGTTMGTVTDVDGSYTISSIPTNAILIFSSVGYKSVEITVGNQQTIDVILVTDSEVLDELVVVGYGTLEKSDVTGAITSIDNKTLKEVPAANLTQALQGFAAGVEIQRSSPRPGGGARIRIRGNRSLSASNEPLLVVDGIPYGGSINDLNPDDIESLEILKDASATAIYGSRGSNGVILVTTKRGNVGKSQISYNGYVGVATVRRKYDVYSGAEFATLKEISTYGFEPVELESISLGRETNWQDLIYQNGLITNHNLSASGGSSETQYSLSGTFFRETTVLPGQAFTRFSIRGTIDQKIGNRVKIGLNTMNTFGVTNGEDASPMYGLIALSPLAVPYDNEGNLILQPIAPVDEFYNPLTLKENPDDWIQRRQRVRTFNSLYLEVDIIKGLKYRANIGLDWRQDRYGHFYGSNTVFRSGQRNQASMRNGDTYSYTIENLLLYDKTFAEKHKINFTGLFSIQEEGNVNSRIDAVGLPSNQLQFYNLNLADETVIPSDGNGENKWGLMSYMARVLYSFDDKYLITLTGRADGSSRLAPGSQWNYYPAVSVAWNIGNEAFMSGQNVASSLKLRAGFGQTSNTSISPYSTFGRVTRQTYNFGSENTAGYFVSGLPNDQLGWEFTQTLNIGVDFGFLQDRITGSVEVYKQWTKDILLRQSLVPSNGIDGSFLNNIGETENKGLEFNVNAIIFDGDDSQGEFTWEISANLFLNREKIVALADGDTEDIGNGWFVGQPIDVIYDFQKIGIWQLGEDAESFNQNAGEIKVADLDGDGAITADNDRKILGNYQPDFQGGFTTKFAYKGFDLSINGYFRVGGMITSVLHQPGSFLNMLQGRRSGIRVDFWTPDNPTNDYPRPDIARDNPLYGSTLGYFDGSFLKIRSINLGYTFPSALLERIGFQQLRVYATAQNPFVLFSPYLKNTGGVDPEPTGTGGGIGGSVPSRTLTINANTPPTMSFIFGLNFRF